jgi:hypothetical protein
LGAILNLRRVEANSASKSFGCSLAGSIAADLSKSLCCVESMRRNVESLSVLTPPEVLQRDVAEVRQ